MDREALLRTLRAAFATDLADGVRSLEEGLVALERGGDPEHARERLREVFRVAHGLKGGARAAGLAPVEATCHAMESLLGQARDHGRLLGHDDFAALLGAVDALKGVEDALRAEGPVTVDDAALGAAQRRVEGRLAAAGDAVGGPQATGSGGQAAANPHATSTGSATATPAPAATASPTSTPVTTRAGTATPNPTPAASPSPPPADDPDRPRREPLRSVRVPAERLDAIWSTGAALLLAARQEDAQASRAEVLARDLRKARLGLAGARPVLTHAAETTAGLTARAARLALAAEERLRRLERELLALRGQLADEGRAMAQGTRRLAAEIRELRLVPWGEATAGLDRVARDVAQALRKEVEVVVEGAGLEVDQSVVAALRDPLAHLVRNAVDHGLEAPAARAAAGKPPRGLIKLTAQVAGPRVLVQVSDDGGGLDAEALRSAAERRGIPVPEDRARLLELVFLPGFSTRERADEVSGRGVGLDAVASTVRALRGHLRVESEPGRGTAFTLSLPATLHGMRALVARDGGQPFALAATEVERVARVTPDRLRTSDGRPVLVLDAPVPAAPLSHVLGLAAGPWDPAARRLAVVLSMGGRRGALLVEDVLAERELALEPLGEGLASLPFVAGAALLAAGDLALVLRSDELLDALRAAPAAAPQRAAPAARKRRIVLADDAATTRALARSLLEAAGYEVAVAPDGEAALALLSQNGADLVLSDVEMPRMDGIELTRAVRATPRLAKTPVVLLTGLASEEDRRRGLEAGADAYLVKSSFDQRVLLDTVAELLEGGPT